MTFEAEAKVTRVRHSLARALGLFAKVGWAASFLTLFATMTTGYPQPAWVAPLSQLGALVAVASTLSMIASFIVSFARMPAPAVVRAHGAGLSLQRGAARVPVEVASAHATPGAFGGGVVEVTARDGDVWEIELDAPERGPELVRALGFGPGGKPTTFALASRFRRLLHLAVGYGAYNIGSMLGFMVGALVGAAVGAPDTLFTLQFPATVVVVAALYAAGKRLVSAPEVTVGADGVRVRRFGFQTRFYPLAELVAAEQLAWGGPILLRLSSGAVVTVGGVIVDARRRDALAEHVRALLAARDAARTVHAESVARGGRSVRAWRAHLRALLEGGYRTASTALTREALAELVARPGAPLDQRVGAALALRVSGDVEASARIRVAADQCVDASTRAALEAAATEEAEELQDERLERLLGPSSP